MTGGFVGEVLSDPKEDVLGWSMANELWLST